MIRKKGEFSNSQIFYAIITFAVIIIIGYGIAKVDVTKYFDFLPDFGDGEDKVIEDVGKEGLSVEEQRKSVLLDFKKRFIFLENRFDESELRKYDVPCILGIFDDPIIPEENQLIIDFKKETKGRIDFSEIVERLTENNLDSKIDDLVNERNEKALDSLLETSYESPFNVLCFSSEFDSSGNLEKDKPELLLRLIDVSESQKINNLLECLKEIPANDLLLTEFAKDLGVVEFKMVENPEFEIYYANNLGGFVDSDLIKSIKSMDFIVSRSEEKFETIVPKIIITHESILVYDMSSNRRVEGDLVDINLVIVRYNGKNYWSTDDETPLKPFCYGTIQN